MKKTLIIIPAYNEEENILKTVESIKKDAPQCEYVIINDGSSDNTEKICIENNLNYVTLIENLGVGGAVQTGYKYAYENGYSIAVQIDGDGQHNPSYISQMEKKLNEGYDLVIGSRFLDKQGFQSTFVRRIGISFFAWLITSLCKQKITDPTSGLRMVNRKLIELFANKYPDDYPEPESIVTVLKKGYNATEIPVLMNAREGGITSITSLKSVYYMIKVTISILFAYNMK